MRVLAVETSGTHGSVACGDPEAGATGDFREEVFEQSLSHGRAVAPAAERLLRECGWRASDLDLLAVGLGPGSFTGVRVGIAFVKGLALGTGRPVVGVPSLEALARNAPADAPAVATLVDARWGEAYLAVFRRGAGGLSRELPETVLEPAGIAARIPADAVVIGNGLGPFGGELRGRGCALPDPDLARVSAVAVACLAASTLRRTGPSPLHALAPIYLRGSHAERGLREPSGKSSTAATR
ncbi:MAG: tRNA (adenosine(37)-N6)-threonylcarbamoyltransferase complex dimerization subunit type 1 TsaB [Planctomycetales bacterium]|nr:tRNA (adenosine(37)-N6)-threonylcarbamoyltransferase complex dimerization subunit type 1 TsaB [Planctomycetales bacterium]